MVASKRVHCAYCQKKCSGNVLRYQDQYYHKQCFEQEQSELAAVTRVGQTVGDYLEATTGNKQYQPATAKHGASSDSIEPRHLQKASHNGADHQSSPTVSKYPQQTVAANKQSLNISAASPNQQADDGSRTSRQNISNSEYKQQQQQQQMAPTTSTSHTPKGQTLDDRVTQRQRQQQTSSSRAATLPHSSSSPANGYLSGNSQSNTNLKQLTNCAGCKDKIRDGQALIALDLHWHVWCFKCTECNTALHGEYVAKDGKAYCERDYQKLFGITCVYCKRYITGKVLQAGEAHHFHPSCARCSKCGDPFVPGEEMYLQGEVTWHPRCGPGPDGGSIMSPGLDDYDESLRSQLRTSRAQSPSLSNRSRSRSISPYSFMTRQYGRSSPAYADSEAVGDLSRIYTISYLNADPNQGYLRRPIEPNPPKSPQFSRPTSSTRLNQGDRSRCSSRSNPLYYSRDRSVPRGMYSVLSSMRSGSSSRARSPSMMNEEAVQLAQYPSGQPNPNSVPTIERDDFPAPPFPYPNRHHHHQQQQQQNAARPTTPSKQRPAEPGDNIEPNRDGCIETPVEHAGAQQRLQQQQQQQRASRPRSRDIAIDTPNGDDDSLSLNEDDDDDDPQFRKEEEELSKIANGIGKIFLQTLKEREKLRAWKRSNLDPRNASRTPSATRELPSRLRYENPTNASPSRDMDRPRPWEDDLELATGEQSPTRTRSSLSRPPTSHLSSSTIAPTANSSNYGYKVIQSNRSTPRPGYGLTPGPYASRNQGIDQASNGLGSEVSFGEQQRIAQNRSADLLAKASPAPNCQKLHSELGSKSTIRSHPLRSVSSAHLHRSMPNVANLHHVHNEGPPKLYPYHLLATSNYRLPPDVDRCHLERHLSNEEFQYIFHCDRLDFYRLPEWKRNELKRRAKLF